jgi:hypothetical protein
VADLVAHNTFSENFAGAVQSVLDRQSTMTGNTVKGTGTSMGISLLAGNRLVIVHNEVRNASIGIASQSATSNSLFAHNTTRRGGVGILMTGDTSGNTTLDSDSRDNGNAAGCAGLGVPCVDVLDLSKGSQTAGTANTYKDNHFGTTSPVALADEDR